MCNLSSLEFLEFAELLIEGWVSMLLVLVIMMGGMFSGLSKSTFFRLALFGSNLLNVRDTRDYSHPNRSI